MKFNNDSSMVGFIGNYKSVEDVVASDEKELVEIGGSFEEISNQIKNILDFANNHVRPYKLPATLDGKITVKSYLLTRGFQTCPFGCEAPKWSEIIKIVDAERGRSLTINRGIEHLARTHHLLEKGNEYGITPKEFYEHFMPDK